MTARITPQTFYDLGMWLSAPERHTTRQLHDLLDEDKRLPCIALANHYWLLGALTHSLRTSSLWPALDNELTAYLLEMEGFYQQRSTSIKQEAIYVCQLLSTAGIKVTLLKGAANLFNGVAKPPSTRFMSDIDILVSEEQFAQATAVLLADGYAMDDNEHWAHAKNYHHAPPLYKDGGACCVELHRSVLAYPASDVLSTASAWHGAQELPLTTAIVACELSPSHQLILSIAHSEISHHGFADQVLDLRQLVNVQHICQRYASDIDWDAVVSHFVRCDQQNTLFALLYAAKTLLHVSTPLDDCFDVNAQRHLSTCLEKFTKRQGAAPKLGYLRTMWRAYGKDNIYVCYGTDSKHWLLKGRMLHLRRQLMKALRLRHWQRLYRKLAADSA